MLKPFKVAKSDVKNTNKHTNDNLSGIEFNGFDLRCWTRPAAVQI